MKNLFDFVRCDILGKMDWKNYFSDRSQGIVIVLVGCFCYRSFTDVFEHISSVVSSDFFLISSGYQNKNFHHARCARYFGAGFIQVCWAANAFAQVSFLALSQSWVEVVEHG